MTTRDLAVAFRLGHMYVRQIPSGHGLTNIYHFGMLTKKIAKASRNDTISFIQKPLNFDHGFIKYGLWYHKMFSTCYKVVKIHFFMGFGYVNAIKYSYCQGMPIYVLVNIKYLLTLRTKLTWHLTPEMTLAHLLKI